MKVLHIQTTMGSSGNAAFRLHSAMNEHGIESFILSLNKCFLRYNVEILPQGVLSFFRRGINSIVSKIREIGKLKETYLYRTTPFLGRSPALHYLCKEADVIYIHWVAATLSINDFDNLAKLNKPLIFYMHDMWSFTGGCHHSFDCNQYITGCKDCPMFSFNKKTARKQIERMKNIYNKYDNIFFVSPSNWMAEIARKSFSLSKKNVYVIPNFVDEKNFKPIGKNIARNILNLPHNKIIITFGCQAGTDNRFKGWSYLRDAINLLDEENILILVYGSDYSRETQEQVKYQILFLGPIQDETKLALICNATDVFVSPSLAESYGLTFLENILSGTPVVGFNNTAISEIIKTGVNGYLANNKDVTDLMKGIKLLITSKIKIEKNENYNSYNVIIQHKNLINKLYEQQTKTKS